MRNSTMGIVASNAAAMSAASLIALRFMGASGAELCALSGIPMAVAVIFSEISLRDKADRNREQDSALFALQHMYSCIRYAGESLMASMGDAIEASGSGVNEAVSGMLLGIRKRMLLGMQLDEAVSCACKGSGPACEAMREIGREYSRGRNDATAISNTYERLLDESKREDAENAGNLQKYMTVSMAMGTVLPSFAVFAFTGYSMAYYSQALFSIFCTAMLVLMPNLFALVRAHAAGFYEV
jgi:hypothetical protein